MAILIYLQVAVMTLLLVCASPLVMTLLLFFIVEGLARFLKAISEYIDSGHSSWYLIIPFSVIE